MANRLTGEVEIPVIDGDLQQTYVLRLDVNALIATQEEWGETSDERFLATLFNILSNPKGFSFKKLRTLMKQGLVSAHPDITDQQAGRVMTAIGLPKMGAILAEAIRWALPERETVEGKKNGQAPGKDEAASPGPTPS